MVDLFASAKSTLRRAQFHITDLANHLSRITRDQPWSYDVERDIDGITEIHKIKIAQRFDELPCIVFDAVNNLRACLDQTSYAVCVANECPDTEFAYFPIVKEDAFLPDKLNGLKELPREIRSFFAGFKPYKGGNNTLWALNLLSNTKKHARLVPIRLGNIEMTFPAANAIPPAVGTTVVVSPVTVSSTSYNPDTNEIILARLWPDPNRGTHTKITFAIVFEHTSEIINGQQPISLLNAMRSEVQRLLLGTEAECRRLNLIA